MMGYYSFLRFNKELPAAIRDGVAKMKDPIMSITNGYIEKVPANAFAAVMGQSARDFNWVATQMQVTRASC